MTARRDNKVKPKKEQPKVTKETIRDLQPSAKADDVKGGGACVPSRKAGGGPQE